MKRSIWLIAVCLVVVTMVPLLAPGNPVARPFDAIERQIVDLGFTPLRPPSRLVGPGSLVQVLARDPLMLGLVCADCDSLGPAVVGLAEESPSVSVEAVGSIEGRFEMSGQQLETFAVVGGAVSSMTVHLCHTRVREISDAAVIDAMRQRSSSCERAVALRRDAGHELTMVKTVLLADVVCTVHFRDSLATSVKSEVLRGLALRFGLEVAGASEATLAGTSMVWGLRDDALLARLPDVSKPSTGGTAVDGRSVLPRRAASVIEAPIFVSHRVEPQQQSCSMGCWATVGAMMHAWKTDHRVTADELVAFLGKPWIALLRSNEGLHPDQQSAFAAAMGLTEEAPQNYSLAGYEDLLTRHGPLWLTTGDLFSCHARLIVGIVGGARWEDTVFEVIDPATGERVAESATEFLQSFEAEARALVALGDEPLRCQVLHW